jgi:hypothetical protein
VSGPPEQSGEDAHVDIPAMRESATSTLAQDPVLPRHEHVQELALRLRQHLVLIIPEVQDRARSLPGSSVMQGTALAAVAEARVRLATGPGCGLVSAVRHAQGLARTLRDLCAHYEALDAAAGNGRPR